MKAVVFEQHGDVDGIEWREWPDPVAADDEVLIKVEASSFNGFEPMVLRGIPGLKTPLPMIPGADVSGVIVGRGNAVPQSWREGDRALVMPLQIGRGMMGETLRGGFCEYITAPHRYLIRIPAEVSFAEAAALPVAYGTAYRMIMRRGDVQTGERVLILGAAGGVGTCCVQLAKLRGAEVIGCTSSPDKAQRLLELGADHVINTSTDDFVAETIRLCGKPRVFGEGGGGVDVVINFIGGESWAKCLRVIRRGGRMLTCGATDGHDPKTDIRYIWSLEIDIRGSNAWSMDDIAAVLDLVAQKRLTPAIHDIRPMKDARQAMRDFIDRKVFGKLIVVP
jgi:alcohol dehydrogenase